MKQGRHQDTTTTRRGWRKLLPSGVLGWTLFAGAGVAIAAWIILSGVSGTVTTATADLSYDLATAPVVTGDCTASYLSVDDLEVTWAGGLGGETCTINAYFIASTPNDVALWPQGFAAPTGINASLGAWCGAGGEYSAGITQTRNVTVVLEIDEATTTFGDSFVFDALTHGFQWVPASLYDAGACS